MPFVEMLPLRSKKQSKINFDLTVIVSYFINNNQYILSKVQEWFN